MDSLHGLSSTGRPGVDGEHHKMGFILFAVVNALQLLLLLCASRSPRDFRNLLRLDQSSQWIAFGSPKKTILSLAKGSQKRERWNEFVEIGSISFGENFAKKDVHIIIGPDDIYKQLVDHYASVHKRHSTKPERQV